MVGGICEKAPTTKLHFLNNFFCTLKSYFCGVRKKNKLPVLENILVTDYAAEGKSLVKIEGKVIFISGAIPGDIVNIQLVKSKKDWAEGRVIEI